MDIKPNVVECPNCQHTFTNNRINGLALIELVSDIDTRKKIQCRLTLNALEREYNGQLPASIRKIILDGYNGYARDLATMMGFGTEAE